jgi:hypothetical protein
MVTQFAQKRLDQSSENKVSHRKKISDCVLQFVSLKCDVRELRNNDKSLGNMCAVASSPQLFLFP